MQNNENGLAKKHIAKQQIIYVTYSWGLCAWGLWGVSPYLALFMQHRKTKQKKL